MVRRVFCHIALFVLLGLLLSPVLPPTRPSALSTVKYLLVQRDPMHLGEDDTPSRALLITDPDEIRKVHALVDANVYTGHTCGFDWQVSFWASAFEVVDSFSINESCDRYDAQMEAVFQQVREQPTHFIYNLRIPVDVHPQRVIGDLGELNFAAFLLDGPNPHLPHTSIAVFPPEEDENEVLAGIAQNGEARLRSIVEDIAEWYPVEILGKIHCPDYRYRGEPGCPTQATIWFEQGADLTGITHRVEALGGRTWGKSIPSAYYDVQLVIGKQDLEEVQQMIASELGYVLDLSRYGVSRSSKDAAAAEPLEEWIIECVDCPKQFYWMTDRSLRLDAEGHPHMAYGKDHLYYAWHDGVSWHYETADDAPGVGMNASLVLDGNGSPHISYYDEVNDDLRCAHRDASGWHVETVDSAGDIGKYTSIALDEAGFPHISYYDQTNENLKHAFKSASGWHTETVGDSPGVAWHTSLALDGAGYPHISYYDDVYGSIQYAYHDASGWHIETVARAGFNGGGHTSLALDGAGHPHISYSDGHPYYVLEYAYRDASNWHVETIDSVGGGGAHSSLALDRNGYPHVSYYNGDSGSLKYAYRDASGWQVQTVDSQGGELRSTSLALDDGGYPHIGYHAWSDGALRYARRDPSGWRIETMDGEGDLGMDTSLVLDEQGYPHISYLYADYQRTALKYAYQDASGWHTWAVDNTQYAGGDNSLALDGDGYAHISYYQGGATALKYAYQDAGGWHTEIVDDAGYVGTDTSLALDGDGFPHIGYCDRDNHDLKHAYQDASGWHIEIVDSEGDVGWSTSLALDRDGYPHISYFDWGNDDLKYAYRDASGWHIQAVDADTGDETSLALDESGYPHISYYGARALKYAYQDASGWHIEMADEVGEPGWYTSLVLDGNGNPHISYNDRASFDLKYAYHDASGWHIEAVDSEGDVGSFASLALDGLGRPRISYYDRTNGDLEYAFKNGAVRSIGLLADRGDGGPDVSLTPAPEQPTLGSGSYVDLGCIYVGETIVLDAEMWGRYGIGTRLSSGQHGASIADGKICWHRGEELPEHFPFPLPSPQEAEATPTETPLEGAACSELVTSDRIGEEDFEEFDLAEKLENGQFQRQVSENQIACWYQRVIDGAIVEGDHLYYLFDPETGELLKRQVWWRSDLAEHLPSSLITREEAEAMAEGEVQKGMLVIIHPDSDTFRELESSLSDSGTIQTTKPTTENPCWLVYSYVSQAGGDRVTRLAVGDAVTGEMLGYTDLQ